MSDERPPCAIGHVFFDIPSGNSISSVAARLVLVGMREIFKNDAVAVLELRGATHVVVRKGKPLMEADGVFKCEFDLMYDDIKAAKALFDQSGYDTTEIEFGRIHDEFWAKAPEGFRVHINSSHASGLPV